MASNGKGIPITGPPSDDAGITLRQCRTARAWHGWSQVELARRAGIDQTTVARFELGRPATKATLRAIRRAFEDAGGVELGGKGVRVGNE